MLENKVAPAAQALRERVEAQVVGQAQAVEMLILGLLTGGHLLLEGAPGLAKTLLARAFAQALSVSFGRVQFTSDLLPSDILGTVVYDLQRMEFAVKRGPIFTNILLGDEINRAPPKTQAALLEAMEEGQVTLEGRTMPLDCPFMVVATQNPVEFEGTYPLPEAQLDRFMLKIPIGYPTLEEEVEVLRRHHLGRMDVAEPLPGVVNAAQLAELRSQVSAVRVEEDILAYIASLVRATRECRDLALGSSPRGAISLLRGAKARAAVRGRDYCLPEDVKGLFVPALAHRIILRPEAEVDERRPESILAELAEKVPVPR